MREWLSYAFKTCFMKQPQEAEKLFISISIILNMSGWKLPFFWNICKLEFLLIDIGKVYDLRCQFSIYSFYFFLSTFQKCFVLISEMKMRWDAFYCMPLRFNYDVKFTSSTFFNFMYNVRKKKVNLGRGGYLGEWIFYLENLFYTHWRYLQIPKIFFEFFKFPKIDKFLKIQYISLNLQIPRYELKINSQSRTKCVRKKIDMEIISFYYIWWNFHGGMMT